MLQEELPSAHGVIATDACYGESGDDETECVRREYRKREVDRAGAFLVKWWTDPNPVRFDLDRVDKAVHVVQNWRTSHAMPLLMFRLNLTKRARRINPDALIAQRVKRFPSIMAKLAREPNMKLSQMQDLGGCRAILSDVRHVEQVADMYRRPQELFDAEGLLKCYDYVSAPKPDGYRGIHIVGRYRPQLEKNEPWDGYRIEVQLRSALQHAFATAVETVTTFTRFPLKFGSGPDEWRRFFSLTSSAFAIREMRPIVEGAPSDRAELTRELREISRSLRVRQRLAGWARALRQLRWDSVSQFKWLLLVLNVTDITTKLTGYSDTKEAARALNDIEKMKRNDLDAVLVWVNTARDLRNAYPNYYADTGEFIQALNQALRP